MFVFVADACFQQLYTCCTLCVDSWTLICLCVLCARGLSFYFFGSFCFPALQDPAGEGRAGRGPDSGPGGNKDHIWKYPRHL